MAKTRAVTYARISRDSEKRGLGISRQQDDTRALVKRKGWTLAGTYVDNDISAARKEGKLPYRPQYQAMLSAIQAGDVDAVVVWDQDRLVRDPLEGEEFYLLCERAGMHRLATIGGDVDIQTGEGILVARIRAAVAAEEVRKIRTRVQRKHLELAQAGKDVGGGTRPFGYEPDRSTIREGEAVIIREAASRVLAGASIRSIAADLTARGVATVTGRPWHPTVLRNLLTSPRIAGLRGLHGEVVAKAEWPGIIDRATHEQLRAVLKDPERMKRKQPARRYLLTGTAICGLCGAKLVARPRSGGRRCYVCTGGPGFHGCGKIRVLAEPLEEVVTEALFEALDSPKVARALASPKKGSDTKRLGDQLVAYQGRLETLKTEYSVEGLWSKTDFVRQRNELERRIEDVRSKLAERNGARFIGQVPSGSKRLRQWWESADVDERRSLVSAMVEAVEVRPAVRGRHVFDPSRVELVWRF
jgi:DNA invertase Pin-like site-specific DNA recombinase